MVAWLNAESIPGVITGLAELARELRLVASPDDTEAAAIRALRWLETCRERCLVVYDNATDPDALRPWLPAMGLVRIIITTTQRAFANVGELVDVELFTPSEAAAYLTERVGPGAGSAELAAELGHLPLALAQAATLMRERRWSYGEYCARLRDMDVAEALPRMTGDPYPRGAAEAITLSLNQAARAIPRSERLIALLSVLSPDGVTVDLLSRLLKDSDVGERAGRLAELSVVTFSGDGTTVTLHRLVRRIAHSRAEPAMVENVVYTALDAFGDVIEPAADRAAEPPTGAAARLARIEYVWAQFIDLLTWMKTHPLFADHYTSQRRQEDAETLRGVMPDSRILHDAIRRWEESEPGQT